MTSRHDAMSSVVMARCHGMAVTRWSPRQQSCWPPPLLPLCQWHPRSKWREEGGGCRAWPARVQPMGEGPHTPWARAHTHHGRGRTPASRPAGGPRAGASRRPRAARRSGGEGCSLECEGCLSRMGSNAAGRGGAGRGESRSSSVLCTRRGGAQEGGGFFARMGSRVQSAIDTTIEGDGGRGGDERRRARRTTRKTTRTTRMTSRRTSRSRTRLSSTSFDTAKPCPDLCSGVQQGGDRPGVQHLDRRLHRAVVGHLRAGGEQARRRPARHCW